MRMHKRGTMTKPPRPAVCNHLQPASDVSVGESVAAVGTVGGLTRCCMRNSDRAFEAHYLAERYSDAAAAGSSERQP
jgi:hypothetical protein